MTKFNLPKDHKPYCDKYFLRSKEILKVDNLNPFVTMQVFLRGEGKICGINEVGSIFNQYSKFKENGGQIFALKERAQYHYGESVLVIRARIQDIIELETLYLGVITAATTRKNDKIDIDLKSIENKANEIVKLIKPRPAIYMGARHWHFGEDYLIASATTKGGFTDCSTDRGASIIGKEGIGTIPHALENIYAWKYGPENAVVESALAFHRYMDKRIPRIALVDYYNREIDDTISVIRALGKDLYGIRIDTCGENVMQGAIYGGYNKQKDYWGQKGVSISGVVGLVKCLQAQGLPRPKIILSSGFGDIEKVKAFVEAEKQTRLKLFDYLGIGGLFPARYATADIVEVGDDLDNMKSFSKIGRTVNINLHRLKQIL